MEKIILAHATENEDLALLVESKLARIGVPFERMTPSGGDGFGQFVARLQATTAPIILFVTDNFLRSTDCMAGALAMLQQLHRTGRVLPVIADGKRLNVETGIEEVIPTNFERVIHAITYMNFWQSVYLEARSKTAGGDAPDPETRGIRDISNEIGEFLNTLRNAESIQWREFAANDFRLFFKKFGILDFYDEYRKVASFDEPMDFWGTEKATSNGLAEHLEETESVPTTAAAQPVFAEPSEAFQAPAPEPIVDFEAENEAENDSDGPETPFFEKQKAEADRTIEPRPQALAEGQQNASARAFFEQKNTSPTVENFYKKNAFESQHGGGAEWDLIADEIAQEAADIHARRLAHAENLEAEATAFSTKYGFADPVDLEDGLTEIDLDLVENEAFLTETVAFSAETTKFVQPMGMPVFQTFSEGEQTDDDENDAENGRENEPKIELEKAEENEPIEPLLISKTEGQLPVLTPKEAEKAAENEAENEVETPQIFAPKKLAEDVELTLRDVQFWLEKGQADEARYSVSELLIKNPACAECWAALGEIEEQVGNFAAAKTHFEKAIVIDPDLAGVHLRLGRLLDIRLKGLKKQAAQHFKAALRQDPQSAEAAYRAGSIYFEHLGKLEKAAKYFEKTVQIDPQHALAWYDLAHLNRQLDHDREAAFFYQKAIETNPGLRTDVEDRIFFFEEKTAAPEVENATQPVDNQLVTSEETAQLNPQFPILNPRILTVLVTGATSGIGRATAEIFAKNGHRVILTGRRMDRLEELTAAFQTGFQNEKITSLVFDVRDRARAEEALGELADEFRDIDLLINNAGLAKGFDTIDEGNWAHWDEMIDTNLKGLLAMTRLVAPAMVARGSGQIINIGSIAGKEVYAKGNVYNATKFAVDALTRSMRLDLVPKGVKVSSISPGHVEETEFALVRFDGDAEKARIYDDFQPLLAADVAETIYFMATRPAHVQIHDIVLSGAQQASATAVNRSGR